MTGESGGAARGGADGRAGAHARQGRGATTTAAVAEWIGARAFKRWAELTDFIEDTSPGVFRPEWLYAGKKHGWSLRFKKSKPLCTLVPERGRFKVLVVFGAAEREKVE